MEKEYLRLNITIKPPKETWERIINLSKTVGSKYASWFILDGIKFYPHITVYSPEYPLKNIEKIINNTKGVVGNTKKLKLTFKGFKVNQGYIGVEFEYTKEIKKFHESIVKELNPLREGRYKKKYDAPDYRMMLSEEKKQNIAKYGYPGSMSLYHPHLSIIRLKDETEAETLAKELKWNIPSFIVDTVAIYKMGEHGTCIESVKEFKLK